MAGERGVPGARAPFAREAPRAGAAVDAAEAAARALFREVGRAGVCRRLCAEFPLDYRFVDDGDLVRRLAQAYRRKRLQPPSDAEPFRSEWVDVDAPGVGEVLLADGAPQPGFVRLPFEQLPEPQRVVDAIVAAPLARRAAETYLKAADPTGMRLSFNPPELKAALLTALTSGTLALYRSIANGVAVSRPLGFDPTSNPKPLPKPSPASRAVVHWIEIVLLDEDGSPMAGEPYEITLPSGDKRTGSLDDAGVARLDGLTESGGADVTFPMIDSREWRVA